MKEGKKKKKGTNLTKRQIYFNQGNKDQILTLRWVKGFLFMKTCCLVFQNFLIHNKNSSPIKSY